MTQKGVLGLVVLAAAGGLAAVAQPQTPPPGAQASRVVAATASFLNTLDDRQRTKIALPLNATTRTIWSNLPTGSVMQVGATERNGLKFGEMTDAQEKAAMAVMASVLSRSGYQKVVDIINGDQRLEETLMVRSSPQIKFGRSEYYLAVLGTPSARERWMLQFGGHHLALNITMVGNDRVLTPSHTGAQPAAYQMDGESIRPLGRENDKAFTLINALDATQQKQALLGYQVRDLVLGPGEDGKVIQPEGIRGSALTAKQRTMLLDLAGEWIGMLDEGAATAKLKEVEARLADTYFAFGGSTTNGQPIYFRIQGPTVVIEYAPQPVARGQGASVDHIHTIYRDPTNEYGTKLPSR